METINNNWKEISPGKYKIESGEVRILMEKGNNGWLVEVSLQGAPLITHYYHTYNELHLAVRNYLWNTSNMFINAFMKLTWEDDEEM